MNKIVKNIVNRHFLREEYIPSQRKQNVSRIQTDLTPYIHFICNGELTLKLVDYNSSINDINLEYSLDKFEWNVIPKHDTDFSVKFTDNLWLRGKNPFGTQGIRLQFDSSDFILLNVEGDLSTLIDWENYQSCDSSHADFSYLFSNCILLRDASKLKLTQMENNLYNTFYGMFYECENLINPPTEISGSGIGRNACQEMFSGCRKLEYPPKLPITNLASYCYSEMFYNCRNLKEVPELPATVLYLSCYEGMFNLCTSIEKINELPATVLAEYCYKDMFANCKNLKTLPKNLFPAFTFDKNNTDMVFRRCFSRMFDGCNSIQSNVEDITIKLDINLFNKIFY